MDKGFLLIVMENSIQMFAEDLPCFFVQQRQPEQKTHTTIFELNYRSNGAFAICDSLHSCSRSYFFIFQK